MKTRFLVLSATVLGGICFYNSAALSQNWTLTTAPTNAWSAVAASSVCTTIVAVVAGGGIYTSIDSGATWSLSSAPSNNWTSVAVSADGTKQVAVVGGGGIWSLADSGMWLQMGAAPETNWSAVACSADGNRLVAAVRGGLIYTSTNAGAVWTPSGAATAWNDVAYSADGSKWAGAADPSFVALSADGSFGVTANCCSGSGFEPGYIWAGTASGGGKTAAPQESWGSIACSANGARFAALAGYLPQSTSHPIYISASVWVSWAVLDAPNEQWQDLALSEDGNRLVAVVKGGGIYTWQPNVPVIATPPQNRTVLAGSSVSFSVDVFSNSPVSYQWRFNGADMPGQTNATLTLTNVYLPDAGAYSVLLASSAGTALSSAASLALLPATVSTQPPTRTLYDAVLNASVTPAPYHTLVWFEWGSDTNYGNLTPATDLGESSTPMNFGSLVTGLTPYTTYHYQVVASNAVGRVVGGDVSFTTAIRFAQTASPTNNWAAIVCSADGTRLVAMVSGGPLYMSTDSGANWTSNSSLRLPGQALASSADTMKLSVAVGSAVYTSADGGKTWSSNSAPAGFAIIAASAAGDKLVAAGGGNLYTSTNSGAGWILTSAPSREWTSLASSADGTKLIAAYYDTRYPGVYRSVDSGKTWAFNTSFPYGMTASLSGAASSADGITLALGGGRCPISTNSGATWKETGLLLFSPCTAAMSADGSAMVLASGYTASIWSSIDRGATWSRTDAPRLDWWSIASSADGSTLAAVPRNGPICVAHPKVIPALCIRQLGGEVALSWPALGSPVSFVLQQSTALGSTNWTAVSTVPTLDLTNMQKRVLVPAGDRNRFFSLKGE